MSVLNDYEQGKKNRKFRPIFRRFFGYRLEWKKKSIEKLFEKISAKNRRFFGKKSEKFRHLADFSASGEHARRSASGGDFFAYFSAII